MSMKKSAFTLGEVLIALSVIALVAILTVPSLLGDVAAKQRMTKLANTVSNLDYAVERYMQKEGINSFTAQEEFDDFHYEDFLDTKEEGTMADYNNKYKTLNGGNGNFHFQMGWHLMTPIRILANGSTAFERPYSQYYEYFVDVNGTDAPNIIGLDAFIFRIYYQDVVEDIKDPSTEEVIDHKTIVKAGTVTGYPQGKEPAGDLRNLCRNGDAIACFTLAEKYNFAYNYLKLADEEAE